MQRSYLRMHSTITMQNFVYVYTSVWWRAQTKQNRYTNDTIDENVTVRHNKCKSIVRQTTKRTLLTPYGEITTTRSFPSHAQRGKQCTVEEGMPNGRTDKPSAFQPGALPSFPSFFFQIIFIFGDFSTFALVYISLSLNPKGPTPDCNYQTTPALSKQIN